MKSTEISTDDTQQSTPKPFRHQAEWLFRYRPAIVTSSSTQAAAKSQFYFFAFCLIFQ
jgi:hypothetical protein